MLNRILLNEVIWLILVCVFITTISRQVQATDNFEDDDIPSSAVTIKTGETQHHTIHIDGDVDWVRIQASSGNYYEIETFVIDGTNPDTTIELFDRDGTLIGVDDDAGIGLGSLLLWRAEYSGDYFLKIKGAGGPFGRFDSSSGGLAECSYDLLLREVINKPPELSSTITGSTIVRINQYVAFSTLAMDPDGDEVKYQFDWGDGSRQWGKASKRYHTWTTPGNYCIRIRAHDDKGARSQWTDCHMVTVSNEANTEPTSMLAPFCNNLNNAIAVATFDMFDPVNDGLAEIVDYSQNNMEKPYLFKLHNGQLVATYTAMQKAEKGRSVVFKNLTTGMESIVFQYPENTIGEYLLTMYARGVQLNRGRIIVTFASVDILQNKDKSKPSKAIVQVFASEDNGTTWQLLTKLVSKPTDYPQWSSIWQPTPIEISNNKLLVAAIEQKYRETPNCTDTGRNAYRDDTVVLFKSYDSGKTWPYKIRLPVQCGYDHNEPTIALLADGTLLLVFHEAGSGNLFMVTSADEGLSWSTPEIVVYGTSEIDNRYPYLTILDGKPTLLYRKLMRGKNHFSDRYGLMQMLPDGYWNELPERLPPTSYMMCKIK